MENTTDTLRAVRPWNVVVHDRAASASERETALLHEWNLTLRDLRRLQAEVAQTLNENAHLADGDNCTLIRLKRAIGWPNTPLPIGSPAGIADNDACSAFEVAPIDLHFECTHAVYVTGGDSSLCYVTSEQRGRLIVFALNQIKASGKLDEWMNNERNEREQARRAKD